jgi:4-alpha-glucanotransferase
MVKPYIREHVVDEKFGEIAGKIKNNFLDLVSPGCYSFKEDFNTQRKIEAFAYEHPELLDINGWVYNELLALHGEVLFIEDKKKPGHFHPRITMQETCSFRDLDWNVKEAMNNLYNHFYYHRHNEFWKEQAMKKLPALLRATNMLVCAEDLGMIPDCVPQVMSQLYMLSLEIDRMPKDPTQEFVNMNAVPYLSVCTTSTHDMAPIRGWWDEDRGVIQRYYNYMLGQWGEAKQDCEPWICEIILKRHLYSPAMLVILPFQDWMSIDGEQRRVNYAEERINIPSDPHHFWCYRMHKSVEELLQMDQLNARIKQLGIDSGRSCEM